MEPQKILEKLKQDATSKAIKTLDAIYEICIEQEQRKHYDFSIPTIARLGYKRGVPKAQSIRNQTGEKYRTLLRAFSDKYESTKDQKTESKPNDWIEEIANPKLKLLARMQESELKSANKKLREFIPPGTRIEVRDYQNQQEDGDNRLTNLERRALEYLISDDFLKKWDFTTSQYGEVLDSSGEVVMKASTVDAVKKALSYL